ncbi:MAG: response regulator [Gammaproteobacteria bacterium]|jgi:two-component system sensor histidine kinase BarA|nr:response regulator [Gammaproteobacteria bacterium]
MSRSIHAVKGLGLKYQILLITLLPVVLIDIIFTLTHITHSIDQENEKLRNKGHIMARQIAGTAEFNLYIGNDGQLQNLLDQVVGSDDIIQASVYDRHGDLIATAASPQFRRGDSPDYFYFREALQSQNLEHSEVFAADLDNTQQPRPMGSVNLYISRQHLQQKTRQIIIRSGVYFVALLVMATLLTVVISRRITAPVSRMVEHLRHVETGQLGKTVEATEANEIGALQAGLNRMSHALLANRRHLNHRIQQATQQQHEAITDLESKNRELGFARDLAQEANRCKSRFLANMSHEIRTPINSIKGFIGLLGQSTLKASQRRYVEIITKSTHDLGAIVDEILDFSKMESGKLHIVNDVFDLYEVIEQTRDLLFISVLTKGIDLNLIIFSDTPQWVIGDKLRLKQILLNLIGNAVKFTDQGRVVIKVSLEELDEDHCSLSICVEDSGIGISEHDQQSLFQAFTQVESSTTRRFSGTGLGLVISQNLAALMGGSITMQSTPGEGSKFNLRLPFKLGESCANPDGANADPVRALIFASTKVDLMEVRSLFDRAGIITECEQIDGNAGIEPLLQSIRRNRGHLDLLVFDLRQIDIDLDGLLEQQAVAGIRVIVMHYDPGVGLPAGPGRTEFVSIINTSRQIAQIVNRNTPAPTVLPSSNEAQSMVAKKVLLVDDNQVNLKLASELIRLWGHQVHAAEHGEQAFEIYRREKFDLVVLDIQMPDIDGVSLLHKMREYNPGDTAPFVALTANVLNHEGIRLLELGFDYFIGKPIDEVKFRGLLDGHPKRRSIVQDIDLYAADSACSLDYARSLQLSAGNESLLKQIFTILQRDIPQQQQQLAEAFTEQDYGRLGALAHKLQGVTCYVGLPRLRRIVLAFQQQLAGESGESLERLNKQLETELDAIAREVEFYLQQLKDIPLPG